MDADVRAIIEAALEAPSGENAQPWRFHVSDKTIELWHHAESDQSLYNYNNYGTLVCEGAAIENICIKARALGYRPDVRLFPDASKGNLIAAILLNSKEASDIDEKRLADIIPIRTTNRKKYYSRPVAESVSSAIESSAKRFVTEGVTLERITDAKTISRLAVVASTNERIMLGNRELHQFFFSHLTWTEKEDKEKKVGFYIKTLELPAPVQALFRIFKNWNVMRILKAIGFPVLVGKGNAQTYAASSEFGVISIAALEKKQLIAAGRTFQRIWLTAVLNGLSAQPLTGTIFMNFFAEHVSGHFSQAERSLLSKEMAALKSSAARNGVAVIMYRMGYAPNATARASRFSVEDLLV